MDYTSVNNHPQPPDSSDHDSDFSLDSSLDRTTPNSAPDRIPDDHLKLTDFKILKLLGRGGMGVVYEAIELQLNRRVALKVLPSSALFDSHQVVRFENEKLAVASLNHANIVPLYRAGCEHGIPFYSMQLIDGQNLSQIIATVSEYCSRHTPQTSRATKRQGQHSTRKDRAVQTEKVDTQHERSSGSLKINAAEFAEVIATRRPSQHGSALYRSIASFGAEIADALAHAHDRGVIHRDIKPSNILVGQDGKAWVADFGLAMMRSNVGATRSGDLVGTLRYMSPEQASGRKFLVDHRTDIYSLGVTLYELITLHAAFDSSDAREVIRQVNFEEPKPIRALNASVPDELEVIIAKAIAKNPHDRYETAEEYAADLRRFAQDRPILARRASLAKRLKRWLDRHQATAVALAAVFMVTFFVSLIASGLIWGALRKEQVAHQRADEFASRAAGNALIAHSSLHVLDNPGLALALGVRGAELAAGPEINSVLLAALSQNHEVKTLSLRDQYEDKLAISPDGKFALCLSSPAYTKEALAALLVELPTGKVVKELSDSPPITAVTFDPNGNFVLTVSSSGVRRQENEKLFSHSSGTANLWDLRNNFKRTPFEDSAPALIHPQMFSANGEFVALPTQDGGAAVYSCKTGGRTIVLRGHESQVMLVVLSPHGQLAAGIDAAGVTLLWDAASGKLLKSVPARDAYDLRSQLAFSSDSAYLISSDRAGGTCYPVAPDQNVPTAVWRESQFVVHPQYARVACFREHGNRVLVRDLRTGSLVANHQLTELSRNVHYSPDGRDLLVLLGKSVVAMDETTGAVKLRLQGHTGQVITLAVDRNYSTLVTSGADKTVRIWSSKTELEKRSFAGASWAEVPSLSNTGHADKLFGFGSAMEYETHTYEIASKQWRNIAPGRFKHAVHSHKQLIIFDESTVRIVEMETQRKIAELQFSDAKIDDCLGCGDSPYVVIVFENQSMVLWDSKHQVVRNIRESALPTHSHCVSPDGTRLAFGIEGVACHLHSLPAGELIATLPHPQGLTNLLLTDEEGLFTIDSSNVIKQWTNDWKTPTRVFSVPDAKFTEMWLMKDQKTLVAFHAWLPGKAAAWSLESGDLLSVIDCPGNAKICPHPTQSLCAVTSLGAGTSLWNLKDSSLTSVSANISAGAAFVGDNLIIAEVGVTSEFLNHPAGLIDKQSKSALRVFKLSSMTSESEIPLEFCPDQVSVDDEGRSIAIASMAWRALLCDREAQSMQMSKSYSAPLSVVQFVPMTKTAVIASADGRVALIRHDGGLVREFERHVAPLLAGAVSSDAQLFAAGDCNGELCVWEIATGKRTKHQALHSKVIRRVEFTPDDNSLISMSDDGTLCQWDLRTDKIGSYVSPSGIQAFRLLKDGRRVLVVAGHDELELNKEFSGVVASMLETNASTGKAVVVDLKSMQATEIKLDEHSIAGTVDVATGQLVLLTVKQDVVLVDPLSLLPSFRFSTAPRRSTAVAIDAVGKVIATLSDEGISLWSTNTGKLKMELEGVMHANRSHSSGHRQFWNPFMDASGEVYLFGERIQVTPTNVREVAASASPRPLSRDEELRFGLRVVAQD